MRRLAFHLVLLVIGGYLIFLAVQFRNSLTAALEARDESRFAWLEVETRLRERPRTMLFVGDIMLSRGVGRVIEREQDPRYPFLRIAEITRKADFTFGNLESPISNRGERTTEGFAFRAEPRAVEGLVYAGFDALSVANNHIFDYGRETYEDTLAWLRANSIEPITGEPYMATIGDSRVAFVAYAPVLPLFDQAAALRTLTELRTSNTEPRTSVIIVSLHWGEEYQLISNEYQRSIGRLFIDAGADLIIGHHPHVVQEVERYKDGYIAYSLGNFVFDQNFSEETMNGLMLKVFISGGRIVRVEEIPVKINETFQSYLVL